MTQEASRPGRRSIIRKFALNTSTHALPGIARSQSKDNCIFWTISFVIFTGIMIFFVVHSIIAYFQYSTQTSVSIIVERLQAFPAVTICNYSPARYDKLIGPFLNYTNSLKLTNTNDTSTITFEQAKLLRDFLQYKINANESMVDYFFSIESMLINCSYNGKHCGASDFISFLSPLHGNCYTFNAKTKDSNKSYIRHTNNEGGYGKLQLRFYASSHLYVPYVSEDVSVGMVAMIHDNTELPLIDVAGIELMPGRKHKLNYKKKTNYFLSSPYKKCTNKIPLVMQEMFNRYAGADYVYSQGICYTLCTQTYVYKECGCVNPYQWSARSVVLPGTTTVIEAPLCNITDKCYSDATIRLSNTTSIWDLFCSDCIRACSTVDFLVTPSSVSAPSATFAYTIKQSIESLPIRLPDNWSTNWKSEVQNNYVAIDVVCESTQIENYTQEASISAIELLSNVGGHTGLWIGVSFLSIMEFVEMLYRLLRYEVHIIKLAVQNKIIRRQQIR